MTVPFLPISPYVDKPTNIQHPLTKDLNVDVAIIGGGYTGLSTALALKKAGVEVVIIEKHFCGYGASGRNGGHLTPTIGKDMPTAIKLYGKERTADLVRFGDHCVQTTEDMISEYAIDCDYLASGNIMSVVHPKQEAKLREAVELAKSVGAHVHFIEAGGMRERNIPRAFLSGAMEELGGSLHPGKLVMALRKAVLKAGIHIYEQTAVQEVSQDNQPKIITDNGTVTADKVVMATNAYTAEIGQPGNRVCPLNDTLFETEPLTDEQLAAIGGWEGREGIYTAHESLESYRLTAQRTIIGGSKGVRYFYNCKPSTRGGASDASTTAVLAAFYDRFPQLREVGIAHSWSGWIAMTMNFLPMVGQLPQQKSIYYSLGYNGHGMAQSIAMGPILADCMLGRPNPWLDTIVRKPAYLPPEPFRWLGVRSMLAILTGIDRRTDKAIRKQGSNAWPTR